MSEHLRYGGPIPSIYMSVAFTAFLRHSFVPSQFLRSYIVPIVKDKRGNTHDPDNYKGIAVSSVVLKAFEQVLLYRLQGLWNSGNEQFGFKKEHSCTDCSYVSRQTIDYYLSRGNRYVYACALDFSKAYNRVLHYKLFSSVN